MLSHVLSAFKTQKPFHAYIIIGTSNDRINAIENIREVAGVRLQEWRDNQTSPISIEEVKQITSWLFQKPSVGDRKIATINLDKSRHEASNALLKIVEEPPSYVTIILHAQSERDILPTLKSRSRLVRLSSSTITPSEKEEPINLDYFLSIQNKLESQPAEYWLNEMITDQSKTIRQSKRNSTMAELLRLKKIAATNANPRLLLEYASLLTMGEK